MIVLAKRWYNSLITILLINLISQPANSQLGVIQPNVTNNKFYFGGSVSASVPTVNFPINSEPPKINGFRVAMQTYHPRFHWSKADLFLDLSYANWSSSHSNISITALAPILRYQFFNSNALNLFIDLSIGPAYLSKTMFVHNNLGIHYTFQDMIGFGFKFGKNKNTTISWRITHYSNASLSKHNRGITIPIILSIDYHL